jgi:hypothetical protein
VLLPEKGSRCIVTTEKPLRPEGFKGFLSLAASGLRSFVERLAWLDLSAMDCGLKVPLYRLDCLLVLSDKKHGCNEYERCT